MFTGRCYCGAITFRAAAEPETIAYCHCEDCKRSNGGPVSAFAAFKEEDVVFSPSEGKAISVNQGVRRTFCPDCGSSLTGRYDYLPGQVYVPLGIIDQADELKPELHTHVAECFSWLKIDDDLPRNDASGRVNLNNPGK